MPVLMQRTDDHFFHVYMYYTSILDYLHFQRRLSWCIITLTNVNKERQTVD